MTLTYAALGAALADDVIEIIDNDRNAYEAVTRTLVPVADVLHGGDAEQLGGLVREMLTRAYSAQGVDPRREVTAPEALTARLLSQADWRKVGEHYARRQPETAPAGPQGSPRMSASGANGEGL